jgi:hypothetical protein
MRAAHAILRVNHTHGNRRAVLDVRSPTALKRTQAWSRAVLFAAEKTN